VLKGETQTEAEAWYKNVDKKNADEIKKSIPYCDRIIKLL
jgi:(2Fe-2S) ferredoxin